MSDRFSKYDLSPLGDAEYDRNLMFLRHVSKRERPIPFERYFTYLNPRVLDGIVTNSEWEDANSMLESEVRYLESQKRPVATIEENYIDQITRDLVENSSKEESYIDEALGLSELFKETYESVEWVPGMEIVDSSQLEHYKLDSPYIDEIEELRRKSAVNKGRQLPTFLGWAIGAPAAVASGGTIIGGGSALSFAGYSISKALAKRYEARADAIEKKIEDTIYENLSQRYLENYREFKVDVV